MMRRMTCMLLPVPSARSRSTMWIHLAPMSMNLRACATGSSMCTFSLVTSPPTSWTHAPLRMSMAGITSMSGGLLGERYEVADHPQPGLAGLLGMELDAPGMALSDGGGEGVAVGAGRDRDGLVRRAGEAVHVVDVRAVGQPREERLALHVVEDVPPDLGELLVAQAAHLAADVAQAPRAGALLAALEEELHPQADAQQRLAGVERLEERVAVGQQLGRGVPEGAHPGEDDGGRVEDGLGLRDEAGRGALALQRLADAVQVAHAVVQDGDLHQEPPMSLGSASSSATRRRAVAEGGPTVMRT